MYSDHFDQWFINLMHSVTDYNCGHFPMHQPGDNQTAPCTVRGYSNVPLHPSKDSQKYPPNHPGILVNMPPCTINMAPLHPPRDIQKYALRTHLGILKNMPSCTYLRILVHMPPAPARGYSQWCPLHPPRDTHKCPLAPIRGYSKHAPPHTCPGMLINAHLPGDIHEYAPHTRLGDTHKHATLHLPSDILMSHAPTPTLGYS